MTVPAEFCSGLKFVQNTCLEIPVFCPGGDDASVPQTKYSNSNKNNVQVQVIEIPLPAFFEKKKGVISILLIAGIIFVILSALLLYGIPGMPVPAQNTTIPLTTEEQHWIADHQYITVCPDPDFPPFEFYDASGAYTGITSDYLQLIAKKTGLEIRDTRQNDWNTCVMMIRERRVDALAATYTSDLRKQYLNYTDPYYHPPLVIITRDSVSPGLTLDDLNGMSVVIIEGYTVSELLKADYPGIHVQIVPNVKTALRRVSMGMADAYFGDLPTVSWYLEKEGLTNLQIAGEYTPSVQGEFQLAIGVRNDEPELQSILNKGLAAITPEEKDAILHKWIPASFQPSPVDIRILISLIAGVGILLIVVGIILAWNRALRRAVGERTKELSRELDERKKAQESLRESEEKYRAILDNIQDVYYRSDSQGKIVMISPSGAHMLGYGSPDEMIGLDISSRYVNPGDRNALLAVLHSSGFVHDYEVDILRKDGTILTISANSHVCTLPDGTIIGEEGIFRDITQKKQVQEEMIKKTKELRNAYEELAAAKDELKHNYDDLTRSKQALEHARAKLNLLNTVTLQDIQNAIFSLQGYLQLEKYLVTDEKVRDYIEKQTKIISTIINSLKFIKNYQTLGLSPPRWQNVQQCFLLAISHLDLSGISRDMRVNNLEIYADSMLEQVFFTLVVNILGEGKQVTEIRLFTKRTKDGLLLVFEDNGTGIPDEMKQTVFDRKNGYQAGVSLFLAREILSVTGIFIRECGKPGTGARFEITVPEGAYRFI